MINQSETTVFNSIPPKAVVLNSSKISYKKKVGDVGPVDSLDHYKVMITASWYRVLDAILSTGQLFVSAREMGRLLDLSRSHLPL